MKIEQCLLYETCNNENLPEQIHEMAHGVVQFESLTLLMIKLWNGKSKKRIETKRNKAIFRRRNKMESAMTRLHTAAVAAKSIGKNVTKPLQFN